MPSVEELLNESDIALQSGTVEEQDWNVPDNIDDYLTINPVTRTIEIPEDELVLGTESDEQGERKYFKITRTIGNSLDVSKANIYVNYMNANGDKDRYIVTDVAVHGTTVTFSWVLSRRVTAYKGKTHFIICMKWSDSEGNITNEWNTTLAEGTSLEGLETDNAVIIKNADIIEQLLNMYATNIDNEFGYDSTTRCVSIKKNEVDLSNVLGIYTADANASASNIEEGKTAYVRGKKVTGNLNQSGDLSVTIPKDSVVYKEVSSTVAGVTIKTPVIQTNPQVRAKSGKILLDSNKGARTVTTNIAIDVFGDAERGEVRAGKRFTSKNAGGVGITGTMKDIAAADHTITTKTGTYVIPKGYHDGKGKVYISKAEQDKIIAGNIKKGIRILGVTGSLEEGSSSGGIDTSDATATASDIASGKSAYVKGSKVTGMLDDSANVKVIYNSMVKDTVKQTVSGVGTVNIPVIKHTVKVKLDDTSKPVLMGADTEKTVTFNNALNNYGDAEAYQVLSGKTFTGKDVVKGTGTMVDNSGDGNIALTNLTDKVLNGYYKQNVGISSTEKEKIVAGNIKKGVSILGVTGTLEASAGYKTGSVTGAGTDAVTIETGLSSFTTLLIVKDSFLTGTTGISILVVNGTEGTCRGFGVGTGSYVKSPSTSVGTVSVNGGTVTYTPSNEAQGLINNSTYTWYAIE